MNKQLNLRMADDDLEALRLAARRHRLGTGTFARMLILKALGINE